MDFSYIIFAIVMLHLVVGVVYLAIKLNKKKEGDQ
jgi:uncharacterized membrane protein